MSAVKTTLHVVGCAPKHSGYPNAINTLKYLENQESLIIKDHCHWLSDSTRLWQQGTGKKIASLKVVLQLFIFSALSVLRLIYSRRCCIQPNDTAYIPYPSVFCLFFFSLLPKSIRPRLIADFYISIFDSAFRDRNLGLSRLMGRFVFVFERYSLRVADLILVDTEANRLEMIKLFGLPPNCVRSIPLAINEEVFGNVGKAAHVLGISESPVVLFVGNLAPLHGIQCILEAIRRALKTLDFRFILVGTGQEAPAVEAFIEKHLHEKIQWERKWLSQEELAEFILQSDLCIGIFGGSEKSKRVFPFKNYLYLCAGRPVITQSDFSLPEFTSEPPIIGTECDSKVLAKTICLLLQDQETLSEIGERSRVFFRSQLGHKRIEAIWRDILNLQIDS